MWCCALLLAETLIPLAIFNPQTSNSATKCSMYTLINKRVLNDGCICQILRTCVTKVTALPEVHSHRNISTACTEPKHVLSKSHDRLLKCARHLSGRPGGAMNVFDRAMKRQQKKWAASLQDSDKYDYLRAEVT